MSATARYAAASLALGAIAVWASENAFWAVPQEPPTAPLLLLLWLLYSGACAAGLSAVLWGGAGGWPAAFLGGALMGYAVEGMVLATTYGDFPFNLAWTALAWHGLVTGGAVLALSRAPMGPGRRALLWIALGALLAFWAQYWGEEHGVPLSGPGLWSYLLGGALAPVAAGLALDRIGSLPVPPRPVLWAAPALLALAWAVQAALALDPLRLALPPILALLLWTLRRLGCGPRPPRCWARPIPGSTGSSSSARSRRCC